MCPRFDVPVTWLLPDSTDSRPVRSMLPAATIQCGDLDLDTDTGLLRRNGRGARLRAKSVEVLAYLASRPGRLITHEELLRAVWQNTAVSQTVLRVCIREIRAALGDDAKDLLVTVPRRGYRFTPPGGEREASRPFVGRAAELARLHEAFERCVAGHRQLVLVSGEAGAGKTALLDHFVGGLHTNMRARVGSGQAIEL